MISIFNIKVLYLKALLAKEKFPFVKSLSDIYGGYSYIFPFAIPN